MREIVLAKLPGRLRLDGVWKTIFISALATAVFCYLVWKNAHRSLWFDESATFAFSRVSWPQLWIDIHYGDAFYALYYAFMHYWILIFGHSELALRGPSLIAALALIPITYQFAKRVFDERTAIIAVLLIATNTFFLHYAIEARVYSLGMLLTTCLSLIFLDLLKKQGRYDIIKYAALALISVYAHLFSAFVMPAHVMFAIYKKRNRLACGLALVLVAVTILYLPVVHYAMGDVNSLDDWMSKSKPRQLAQLLGAFSGSSLLWKINAALIAAAAFFGFRAKDKDGIMLGILCFVAPILCVYVVGEFRPIFKPNYMFEVLVPMIALSAFALRQIPDRYISVPLLLLLGLQARASLHDTSTFNQDWRTAATIIRSDETPHDVVVYPPYHFSGYDYYTPNSVDVIYPKKFWIARSNSYIPISTIKPTKQHVWIIWDSVHDTPDDEPGANELKQKMLRDYRISRIVILDGLLVYCYQPKELFRAELRHPKSPRNVGKKTAIGEFD